MLIIVPREELVPVKVPVEEPVRKAPKVDPLPEFVADRVELAKVPAEVS